MQSRGFPRTDVWSPNWLFDVFCVSERLAKDFEANFGVKFGEVHKPRTAASGARQLLPEASARPWYVHDELARAVASEHGEPTGATCTLCRRWKWLPIGEGDVRIGAHALDTRYPVITSPETFGDGWVAFPHTLFQRSLAEALLAADPKGLHIV